MFNINQINVVREYFERRFKTSDVTFLNASDNKVVFQVHEQVFNVLCDNDYNVTILYSVYGNRNVLKGGYSIGLLENALFHAE
jgi:hypothetical protein